ncbi:MAG TPA: tol-pal system protein YbgF [Chromatiaceae bacterium]|jgi:tol-pal system protein YbgF|nr:MAG: hypothetical protein N838_04025 [Thiohalocapsa sp. PB-PSB1]QQO55876.1 MAG: tol-pal system protein YbgF [Thiohalocapsa sp. PB-PSB1]HBG95060.1 tol-pal system protein YbgF [Chromatiaceae bacterium]HCS90755.1 tol-pal system protein YbgF [Chromatiaceae bacterium]
MHPSISPTLARLAAVLLMSATPLLLAQPSYAQTLSAQTAGSLAGGGLGDANTEVRLDRLERMLSEQSLSDLLLQVQRLQQEMQELRGQVELQQYRLQQMDRGRFAGFRVGSDEPAAADGENAAAPDTSPSSAASGNAPGANQDADAAAIDASTPIVAPPPQQGLGALGSGSGNGGTLALPSPETTVGSERDAYRAAFDLLKDRDYAQAKQEFTSMLAQYPSGQFADNGLYWLGEIGYVTKDYAAATNHFSRLISDYPLSPKLPGAMLKLGYVYFDQQDLEQARRILTEVAKRFPETTEGRLAKGRLEQMTREGG